MIDRTDAPVIAIVGPTGSGKSDLAQSVAVACDGEIVSADSMQVYRGMDIGTAKIPVEERLVPHHLIDVAVPGEEFSAGRYRALAREAFERIRSRGRVPILTGGTGLYVRAAIDPFDLAVEVDPAIRARWESFLSDRGAEALWRELASRDVASASLIHPNNSRRVVRALELHDVGVSYAEQVGGFGEREPEIDVIMLGLEWERAALYARIDQRVDDMIAAGLLGEVERLMHDGRLVGTAAQAIGYKELASVLAGERTLEDAADEIKRSSRRYAKRQLTWFRADPRIVWLSAQSPDGSPRSLESMTDEVVALLESAQH